MTEGQMDFLGLLNEYTDDQGATVRIREPRGKKLRPVFTDEPEQMKLDFDFQKTKPAPEPEPLAEPAPEPEPKTKTERKPKQEQGPETEPKQQAKPDVEPKPKPEAEPGVACAPEPKQKAGEYLFKQCKRCWCFDCKHNSRNEGVVRDMCGVMMACPACDGCISDDSATICEIGNAKEGCKLRASEEGITGTEEQEDV